MRFPLGYGVCIFNENAYSCISHKIAVLKHDLAAVLIDDEAALKRVYKTEFSIELRPENPTYKSLYYQKDEMNKVRILGKAVGFYSNVL